MKNYIIVLEGRHDEARIHQIYPDCKTISVNGREIDSSVVDFLKNAAETHEIIIFTDPDYAGEKIRSELTKQIGNVTHAFLPRDKAFSPNKRKIGIEHASDVDIKKALDKRITKQSNTSDITTAFLNKMGLIGGVNSSELRNYVATKLHLGHVNGKMLLQRLIYLGISCQRIEELLDEASS